MLAVIENKYSIKYIQILLAPTEDTTEKIEKVFITEKFNQCKTSRTLNINVFELPDIKKIGKLFSKYKLLFLDNSSSAPS